VFLTFLLQIINLNFETSLKYQSASQNQSNTDLSAM